MYIGPHVTDLRSISGVRRVISDGRDSINNKRKFAMHAQVLAPTNVF